MIEDDTGRLHIPTELNILALSGIVVYPQTVVPMAVAQPHTLQLLGGVDGGPRLLGVLALRPEAGTPQHIRGADCFQVGTVVLVHRLLRLPDGTLRVAVEGLERFVVEEFLEGDQGLRARIRVLADLDSEIAADALAELRGLAERAGNLIAGFDQELLGALAEEQRPARVLGMIARVALAQRPLAERQQLLELANDRAGLSMVHDRLAQEIARMARFARRPEAPNGPGMSRCASLLLDWRGARWLAIECLAVAGTGRLLTSGSHEPALLDAALLAQTWLRSRQSELPWPVPDLSSLDLHVHLRIAQPAPDGAVAGLAVAVALAAAAASRQIAEDTVLLGEIALDGRILPIAGLRERIAGSWRLPVRRLLVPAVQQGDLSDLTQEVIGVDSVSEALARM
jgi:ATP-dependent Lon protease